MTHLKDSSVLAC